MLQAKGSLLNPLFFLLNEGYCRITDFFPPAIKKTPLVLKVRITSKCNLSCPFCYLKEGLNKEEDGVLSIDEWKKILSPLPKRTIIDITGAEPLAAKNFTQFIELISSLGMSYSVTTNGTLYNTSTAEKLVNSKLKCLMVSLDGLKKTHNSLRGNPYAFDRTVDFIKQVDHLKKKYKKTEPLINIKTTVLDENHDEIQDLIDFCDKNFSVNIFSLTLLFQNEARGGIHLQDTLCEPTLNKGNTAFYAKKAGVKSTLHKIIANKNKWSFPLVVKPRLSTADIFKYIDSPKSMSVKNCPQYKNNLTLYYDGSITPCDIGLNLGNIREYNYNLSRVYQEERFISFRRKMTQPHLACQGCCSGKHQK